MLNISRLQSLVFAFALVSMSAAHQAQACSVTVLEIPQVLIHRAAIVAEGTATADQFTFTITKFWKGTSSTTVNLSTIKPPSCGNYEPTIPGEQYLLAIDSLEAKHGQAATVLSGEASVFRTSAVPAITRYLSYAAKVSRRDVLAMLRGWHDRTITDLAFARWLHETTPVAEVDDWATFEDDDTGTSLNLNVLRELNFRINESNLSFEEPSCELTVLRDRVVPVLLKALEEQHITPELIESLDQLPDDIEDQLCTGD